jgi:hypothetical protein
VAYSDGRVSRRVLTPEGGGSWAPFFPRRPDAPAHEGLPLAALTIDHRLDRDRVLVTVSLIYGRPHQKTVRVAVHEVGRDPVIVRELEPFGVDPVTLSIGSVDARSPVLPSTASASSRVGVSLEPISDGAPHYALLVRNDSDHAVLAYQYKAFRAGVVVGTGRHKTERNTPLILPGATARRVLPVSAHPADRDRGDAAWQPAGFDRLEITSVLWEDGLVEGDPEMAASELTLAAGRASQIPHILNVFRGTLSAANASPDLDALQANISALSLQVALVDVRTVHETLPPAAGWSERHTRDSMLAGMQQAKSLARTDLDRLRENRSRDGLPALIAEWEAWLRRVQAK